MKTAITVAIAILSLTAFQAQAAQGYTNVKHVNMHATMTSSSPASSYAGMSRGQVMAELAAAQSSGDILANGETGLKLNEVYPDRYPAKQTLAGKTREQVGAELLAAVRSGDMLADGQSNLNLNDVYPSQYPAKQTLVGKSRAQVQAELADALRTGDYMVGGEFSGKCNEVHPTMHEAVLSRQAGSVTLSQS